MVAKGSKDITGHRFTKLLAVTQLDQSDNGDYNWLCECDCGNTCITTIGRLKYGKTKSCGCLKSEKPPRLSHGMSKSKEYKCWLKMKERCLNPNDISYPNYGGSGVEIYEKWVESFDEWFAHIGKILDTSTYYSVDRIDNSVGYFPGNIKWSTKKQQCHNRTKYKSNKSGKTGVKYDVKGMDNFGNPRDYWVATWYTPQGKPKSKSFSIAKLGNELARFAAEEYRDLILDVLRQHQDTFYTDSHGL